MRNGICSKCGNATVHMARNGIQLGQQPHAVLWPHTEPGDMRTGHNTEEIWQLACGTCGYLEFHVLGEATLAFIRKRWPLVPQEAKRTD